MGTNALQSCYPFHGHMILPKGLSFCSSHCSTEQNLNHTHWWWNWCVEHNRMKQGYSILFLHGWQNIINERENTYKSFASVVIQKKLIHRSTSYKASPWCQHTSYVWQEPCLGPVRFSFPGLFRLVLSYLFSHGTIKSAEISWLLNQPNSPSSQVPTSCSLQRLGSIEQSNQHL